MFSFSTELIAFLVKRIFTRSEPVSRTKVSCRIQAQFVSLTPVDPKAIFGRGAAAPTVTAPAKAA